MVIKYIMLKIFRKYFIKIFKFSKLPKLFGSRKKLFINLNFVFNYCYYSRYQVVTSSVFAFGDNLITTFFLKVAQFCFSYDFFFMRLKSKTQLSD